MVFFLLQVNLFMFINVALIKKKNQNFNVSLNPCTHNKYLIL